MKRTCDGWGIQVKRHNGYTTLMNAEFFYSLEQANQHIQKLNDSGAVSALQCRAVRVKLTLEKIVEG